ncbi:MAG: ComEC/Rec2 family competence protein [Synergistes sp.]|nr:ComEC/Rec2 family competence protein [Synergistes sp.]
MIDTVQLSDLSSRRRSILFVTPLAAAPAFFIFLSVCAALYANTFMPPVAAVTSALLLSCAFALFCTRFAAGGYIHVLALTVAFSLCLSSYAVYGINKKITFPNSIKTTGSVTYSRKWGRSNAVVIDTQYGKTVAYVKPDETPRDGSSVFLDAAAFDFKRAAKDGGFDEMLYWRAKGAVRKLVIVKMKETEPPRGIPAWRAKLYRRIENVLPPLSAKYMAAFTVGTREKSIEKIHRTAGTSHLLAVSGLHVWIVAGIMVMLLRNSFLKFIGVSGFVWLYLLISGLPVGGVRAAVMLQLMLLSMAIGRPNEAFNNVSIAGILIIAANPWSFFDVGFRLSMLCALFIASAGHFMKGNFMHLTAMSVMIWFVTAPTVTKAFGEAPLAGLALNIIAVPVFGVVFPIILILSMPSLLGLPLASVFAGISEFILSGFQYFTEFGASVFTGAVASHTALSVVSILLFSAACAMRCGSGTRRAAFVSLFCIFLYGVIS